MRGFTMFLIVATIMARVWSQVPPSGYFRNGIKSSLYSNVHKRNTQNLRKGYNYQQPSGDLGVTAKFQSNIESSSTGTSQHNHQQTSVDSSNSGVSTRIQSSSVSSSIGTVQHNHQQTSGDAGVSTRFQSNSGPSVRYSNPIIHKHIYVHVPPEDEEVQQHQQAQLNITPQKHYKIIFIKAPSYPSIFQQNALAAAQNEEKTLIYVLAKQPEDIQQQQIEIKNDFTPSKPEVYFIKYKTAQKESTGHHNNNQAIYQDDGIAARYQTESQNEADAENQNEFQLVDDRVDISTEGLSQNDSNDDEKIVFEDKKVY